MNSDLIDTKKVLLIEAEKLVRSRGYSGFSYADLENIVGIRKASIHYHYRTKEELVASVLEEYRDRYEKSFSSIEESRSDAIDRIDDYAKLYFDGIDRGLGCLCAVLSAEFDAVPDSLKTGVEAFFKRHHAWLADVYRDGLVKGTVSTELGADEAAHLILSTLEGALLVEPWITGRDGFRITVNALRKSLAPAPTVI